VLVAGVVGLTAAPGLLTASSVLAASDIEPGNLIFMPASGAAASTPTWHTADGCPVGYRASAQVSIFSSKGAFLSRISPAVTIGLTAPFGGTLEGTLSAILNFAQVKPGGQLLFVVGCYSQNSGTGNVQWIQSAAVTRSSDGTSYSSGSGSLPSTLTGPGVAGTGPSSGKDSVAVTVTNGNSGATIAWIAGACVLLIVLGAFAWIRRRNRSQLA
jgi:hypothetical protein